MSYHRQQVEVEAVIAGGSIPFTSCRATELFPLIDWILCPFNRLPLFVLPMRTVLQPVDAGDSAQSLVHAVAVRLRAGVLDFVGPEVGLGDLARRWIRACGRTRPVMPLPLPPSCSHPWRDGALINPKGSRGDVNWEKWLEGRYAADCRR